MDSYQIVNSAADAEEEHLIEEIIEIMAMFDDDKKETKFDEIFLMESYRELFPKKEEIKKKVFPNE